MSLHSFGSFTWNPDHPNARAIIAGVDSLTVMSRTALSAPTPNDWSALLTIDSPFESSSASHQSSPSGSTNWSGLPLVYPYGLRVLSTSGSTLRNCAVDGS